MAKRISRSILEPIKRLYLNHPTVTPDTYEELNPLLKKIMEQSLTIQKENEQREAYRREFTSNVSHELKTPLTFISGFAEIMKSGGIAEDLVKDFSASIYEEAQRLIILVNDIIKLSELEGPMEHLEKVEVDLFEVAKEVVEHLAPLATAEKVDIKLMGTSTMIKGHQRVLYEMIHNLCDNAIKYNVPHGKVLLTLGTVNGEAQLCISDTGQGIAEEEQTRIFERFYRVDKSHSRAKSGTGLGLSIVKYGIAFHNARLSLQSVIGKGTTITIKFPRP